MRRLWFAAFISVLLTMAGLSPVAAPLASAAGTSVGSFEIDGNTPDSPVGEPTDWDGVATSSPKITVTPFSDGTGKSDDSFGMGSKQEEPGGWACITGSSPGKGDITGGKVGFRNIGGKQFVYVNFTRKETTGSADIDYEFNQSAEPNPSCPALPKRTPGDIVIAFDADQGGKDIKVRAFSWTGNATIGTFVPLATGSQGVTWDGATNGDGSNKTGNFGEAVLNLTDTIGEVSCGEFNSVFMKSRSSVEINSALQDRTAKKPVATGLCPISSLDKNVRNATTSPTGPYANTANATPGNTIDYQLIYKNSGPVAATNVVVTDTIQGKQTYVANSCTGATCSFSTPTVTWNLGTVEAGGTRTLTFKTQLDSSFTSSAAIKNIGSVTTDDDSATSDETTVNVAANPNTNGNKDVRNVSTGGTFANAANAVPGNELEYRILVTNSGGGTATNVVVTDTITGPQTYVSGSCSGAPCAISGSTITWTIGTIAAGGTVDLRFRTTVGAIPAGTTQVKNVAVVKSGEPDKPTDETTVTVSASPNTNGNKDVRNVTTSGTFGNSASASPGDTIEYRIQVTNTGNANATGVVVNDTVQSNQTYQSCAGGSSCSFASGKVTWQVGTITPGQTVTLTFQVKLVAVFPSGTTNVKNVAVVTTTQEGNKNTDETTVTVNASPNTSGDKDVRNVTTSGSFANSAAAKPGDVLEYRIVVSNTGNAVATNVPVTDEIKAGQTYVASSCTGAPCSFTSPNVNWTIASLAPGSPVTLTFRVTLASSFPVGTTEVKNTAVVVDKPTDTTTTTVTANPNTSGNKDVRNVTTNGTFANTASASPGDTIEYRIVVTNSGSAPSSGGVVTDQVAGGQTYVSCSGGASCSSSNGTVTWNYGPLAANGGSTTLTFSVTLSGPFTAGTTEVKNTAVVDSNEEPQKPTDETKITVTGTSNLTLKKAADKTAAVGGDTITYTLTYGNTGNATATGVVITETVPAGTTYVSCTGGCTAFGGTVTWTIPSVAPGGDQDSVSMTVKLIGGIDACTICNVATIQSPVQNNNTAVSSNQVCVSATPQSDPSTANASGDALGLKVYAPLLSIPLVNAEISKATSSQTGVGTDTDYDEFSALNIVLNLLSPIADIDLLTASTTSRVNQAQGARQTTVSEVVDLNLLGGLVTADVVRSVANAQADGDSSSKSAVGTTFTNLKVNGATVTDLSPGAKVDLPRLLFGRNAYVAINEQTGSTSTPASGQTSGGKYTADQTVTAIRVVVTGGTVGGLLTLGGPPLEIVVAKSVAHAEHSQTRLCGSVANQSVSGHAFIASAEIAPLLDTSYVNYVDIPPTGGTAHNVLSASVLPTDGGLATTGDVDSYSTGTNGATSSTSSSYAQAANVCLLKALDSTCLIRADLIRSQSNSTASSGARSSNATGTNFVNLRIAGQPVINGTPAPNTVIPLPLGLGFVILNEQFADGAEAGHTGLTVRALRVVLNVLPAPLDLLRTEVIVAEAHSDATFR